MYNVKAPAWRPSSQIHELELQVSWLAHNRNWSLSRDPVDTGTAASLGLLIDRNFSSTLNPMNKSHEPDQEPDKAGVSWSHGTT